LLIQEIKDEVLAGCTIAFTGVIPRNVVPERSEIWQLAESFGAVCVHELSSKVTHLVTATFGTEKMHKASQMVAKTGIHIVWLAWLQESIALWKHVPEGPHLAQPQAVVPDAPTPTPTPGAPGDVVDAEGDVSMDGDGDDGENQPANGEDEEGDNGISPDLQEDAALFNTMWDDDAQAEFDKFMEEDSEADTAMDTDDDDSSGSDDEE
jgi:RNA polymerase II subunit A-like phosphatase